MAHGIHLSHDELQLFLKTKAGISHCPNSNYSLNSGIINLRYLMNKVCNLHARKKSFGVQNIASGHYCDFS